MGGGRVVEIAAAAAAALTPALSAGGAPRGAADSAGADSENGLDVGAVGHLPFLVAGTHRPMPLEPPQLPSGPGYNRLPPIASVTASGAVPAAAAAGQGALAKGMTVTAASALPTEPPSAAHSEGVAASGPTGGPAASGPRAIRGRRKSVFQDRQGELLAGALAADLPIGWAPHSHQLLLPKTPQHIACFGTIDQVMECFPPGVMHSLAARVPVRILLSPEDDIQDRLLEEPEEPPEPDRDEDAAPARVEVVVDLCVYCGQNAFRALEEMGECLEVLDDPAAIRAELARVLGPRVDAHGYVAPWLRLGGGPLQLTAPGAGISNGGGLGPQQLPAAAGLGPTARQQQQQQQQQQQPPLRGSLASITNVLETVEAGYQAERPRLVGIGPRPQGARAGEGPAAPRLPAAEGILRGGGGVGTPKAFGDDEGMEEEEAEEEEVRAAWSSEHYEQPAGWDTAHELTVFTRGYKGENIFHICILERASVPRAPHNHAAIRYLADLFGPRLVCAPHQLRTTSPDDKGGLYEGKTPLHLAILLRDARLVQFLVERGANVSARCTGTFFCEENNAYYGEYPLNFAICTGQEDVAEYLLTHGARVNEDRDSHGNYALHMAVFANRLAVFNFLVDRGMADTNSLNAEGETPKQLAARLNRQDMFFHILYREREVCWTYGGKVSYNLHLRDVEGLSRFSAAVSERRSVVEVLVYNGFIDIVNSMPIVRLLERKWKRGARGHFYATALFYCAGLTLFTLLCQNMRRSLLAGGVPPGVLKEQLMSAEFCTFETYTKGKLPSTVPEANGVGRGKFNCDSTDSNYFPEDHSDLESAVLEWSTLSFAIIMLCIEFWDMSSFLREKLRREALLDFHRRDAATPTLLAAIPGGVLLDRAIQSSTSRSARGRRQYGHTESVVGGKKDSRRSRASVSPESAAAKSRDMSASSRFASALKNMTTALRLTRRVAAEIVFDYIARQPFVILAYVFILLIFVHFGLWYTKGHAQGTNNPELAIGAIAGWLYLLHYARGFQQVGHFTVIIMRIFTDDILKWALIYSVFLGGFGIGIYLMVREEWVSPYTTLLGQDFTTLGYTLLRLFRHTIGDEAWEVVSENEPYKDLTMMLMLAFTVTGTLCLFNLLVALMTTTFIGIHSDALRHWRMQWALLIIQLERRTGRRSLLRLLESLRPERSGCHGSANRDAGRSQPHGAGAGVRQPDGRYDTIHLASRADEDSMAYTIVNVIEDIAGSIDPVSADADPREQRERDNLRRNVRWTAGFGPADSGDRSGGLSGLAPPAPAASAGGATISEVDALFEKHLPPASKWAAILGAIGAASVAASHDVGGSLSAWSAAGARMSAPATPNKHGRRTGSAAGSVAGSAMTGVTAMSARVSSLETPCATCIGLAGVAEKAKGPLQLHAGHALGALPETAPLLAEGSCALFMDDVRVLAAPKVKPPERGALPRPLLRSHSRGQTWKHASGPLSQLMLGHLPRQASLDRTAAGVHAVSPTAGLPVLLPAEGRVFMDQPKAHVLELPVPHTQLQGRGGATAAQALDRGLGQARVQPVAQIGTVNDETSTTIAVRAPADPPAAI